MVIVWPYSTLPCPDVLRPTPLEEQGRKGGRRGLSSVRLPLDGDVVLLEIAHYATRVVDWMTLDNQQLWVWARQPAREVISGVRFSHPIDESESAHGGVWQADEVRTKGPFRKLGIASALYAHAHLYGYRITRSYEPDAPGEDEWGQHGGGDALWDRLHPGYDLAETSGTLPLATFDRTPECLEDLIERFGPREGAADFTVLKPLSIHAWGLGEYGLARQPISNGRSSPFHNFVPTNTSIVFSGTVSATAYCTPSLPRICASCAPSP